MKKSLFLLLSLPLFLSAENVTPHPKLVVTHAMGMMPAGVGSSWEIASLFPRTRYAENRPHFARMFGGNRRMMPLAVMYSFVKPDGSFHFNDPLPPKRRLPAEALYRKWKYRWDLEKAEEQGIDGFGLCLSGNEPSYRHAVEWFRTLEAMLKENPSLNLRLIPMICGNDLAERKQNPAKYQWMFRFVKEFRSSPAWMRRNGRPVLMGYKSHVTWKAEEYVDPEYIKGPIKMHQEFFRELGLENAVFLFDGAEYAPGQITPSKQPGTPAQLAEVAGIVCNSFEAYGCWGGVIPDEIYQKNYPPIAEAVRRKNRAWMMPILDIHSGIGQFYRSKPGVERLVETWNFAEKTGASIAQLVTWNDWNEATGFAPANSFNYALAGLNSKFIYRFKHGSFPETGRDEVFLFYRKYHPDADPELYPRATVERDRDRWGETDDMLHIFVFAKAPGTVKISGTDKGSETLPLQKGYNEFKLKTAVGKEISARIYRYGNLEHELISPERVTARPYREDLIPWGWSSRCRELYDRDFGKNFRPLSEYSERWNDGIPDWFRLHWFGTTERIAGSAPDDDPDGDGIPNLQEYQLGENPLKKNPVYPDGYRWNDLKRAFSPIEDQHQPARERINLNPFPDAAGKLVHGFLYCSDGVFDGVYPWMMKWVNRVQNVPTGWTFRSGKKHSYTLGPHGGIAMQLAPETAGIYRFLPPVAGTYTICVLLHGDPKKEVTLRIMNGSTEVQKIRCPAGKSESALLTINLPRRAKLDFIASADGAAVLELLPEITLKKNGEISPRSVPASRK